MIRQIKDKLLVPENYKRKDSPLFKLPYVRHLSLPKSQHEPIYYFNGGPGISNFSAPLPAELLRDHEMVRLEYRGVGESGLQLLAPEVARVLTRVEDALSLAEGERLQPAMTEAFKRLERKVDLRGFGVDALVEDVERLRRKLGHNRIHLIGHSFGTRVALGYMARYPQHCARAVLAAPNGPGGFIWSPKATDDLLKTYAQIYARSYPKRDNLYEVMTRVSKNMPKRWTAMSIQRAKVQVMSHMLLFNPMGAKQVFASFYAADRGDNSGLAFLSQSYNRLLPGMFSWGAFFAMGISADYDEARLQQVDAEGKDSVLGSLSSLLFGSAARTTFAGMGRESELTYASEVPTLLLTGQLDTSTPPAVVAANLLPILPNGQHLYLEGMGHVGPMYNQSDAFAFLARGFLQEQRVSPQLYRTVTPDLKTDLHLPLMARTGLGFAALFAASLVFKFKRP